MQILIILMAAVLGVLMPEMAWADTLTPLRGGNTWDLYVFGNGRVIFDILNSIKMLMVPTAGSTGFNTLLLCMASLGFLVLAVAAGFDPGKNLIRMFTYILVVWGVSWGSTSLTANVNVNDLVVNQAGLKENYVVDGVPALVALPAALTSQVGYYFTTVMETYFSMPDGFKTSSAGGQFNLFAKMVQEGNEFQFTDPKAKQTMQAYIGDCVVPAIAMGSFHGSVKDPLTGKTEDVQGATVLAQSSNLMDALATASNQAIMTKVYANSATIANATGAAVPAGGGSEAMGTLLTCDEAYKVMKLLTQTNASHLAAAASAAYAKAGVMVPYETLYSSMLAGASAPTGTTSRASGYILQQGMLNSMNGSFRQAAMQTGNNELMTAASIAQAEQSQRSSWVAGFHVFNNMMGYVFTVLQAFIFAITPMIVVALMVPGLGKSIFTNYAQILIWLTLWMPMLALINYIITLFGTTSIETAMSMSDGVSLSNKGEISVRTTNLVIAAQFLGTMTPLLTWGLVKGAMAFTEFISSGVGSAFASQAGASAATGNMSLNNMSMDNTSMNKFNTAMSSTVGTQATNAFTNAGALMTSHDLAGSGVSKSGGAVDYSRAASDSYSKSIQESKQISEAMNAAFANSSSVEGAIAYASSHGDSRVREMAASRIRSAADAVGAGSGIGENLAITSGTANGTTVQNNKQLQNTVDVGAGGKVGVKTPGFSPVQGSLEASASMKRAGSEAQSAAEQLARQQQTQGGVQGEKEKLSANKGAQDQKQAAETNKVARSDDASRQASERQSASFSKVKSEALSQQNSITESLQAAKQVVDSFKANNDLDPQLVAQHLAQIDSLRGQLAGDAAGISSRATALAGQLTGRESEAMAAYNSTIAGSRAAMAAMGPGSGAPANFNDYANAADTRIKETRERVEHGVAELEIRKEGIEKRNDIIRGAAENGLGAGTPNVLTSHMTDLHTGAAQPSKVDQLDPSNLRVPSLPK